MIFYRKYILLQCRKKSTGFRPNLLVKILKSTGQTCQICHMYVSDEYADKMLRRMNGRKAYPELPKGSNLLIPPFVFELSQTNFSVIQPNAYVQP